jgi:hypothetical protein
MTLIDAISFLSVPLAIKSFNGHRIGTATGFFWRKENDKTYLISNHHVFSGNHYLTHKSSYKDSAFPAKIEYPRFVSEQHLHERSLHTVLLCDDAGNDPTWKSHPIHERHAVDFAFVEVPTRAGDGTYVYAINDEFRHECDKPMPRYDPGFELLIAGFFLSDRPTGYFPIYIKGSVASEIDALYKGQMAFLVDALTSSGMSGSPVFATGPERVNAEEKFSPLKTMPRFVGIYSGRIVENDNGKERELQVGIVWRRELIHEAIQAE